ncbi:MAG: 2-oxo acid dehydrogenase subunit E2 [Bacteroidetes bacterium]|nr:MAG: 2-oxo acid dehydrogenase subunit E2 [Bacteroidota bacterium]TAF92923.1 MAG: 2-oxo acid dehydrogenase subunit E2 [Bacteroidota bacterium]
MALVDLVMPKMGESIMEATILKWTKNVGDAIAMDETLLEIATDKVDSEVPSTTAGVLAEILFQVNDVVPIGTIIARVETAAAATAAPAASAPAPVVEAVPEVPFMPAAPASPAANTSAGTNTFYSPLVLNIAATENISMAELATIAGTGNEGRVTKKDILAYVAQRKQAPAVASTPTPAAAAPVAVANTTPAVTTKPVSVEAKVYEGNVEIIEMDRMRKLIAKHMVDSKHISPHVTSFAEADVTNMVVWRNKVKDEFERREGTKITFTPLFIDCITRVIKRFPFINCSIDGDNIILKKDINIGMATALPSGNLIVPVIKNADYLNLVGLSKQVNTLANNARKNKLKPDDTAQGTFTLTNVGTFGSLMGTPIINQPQVAIMAVGAIKKRPVVIETPLGDTIGIRHMMYLSLSYDHRIVDGSIGASFLTEVAKEFENWDVNREW